MLRKILYKRKKKKLKMPGGSLSSVESKKSTQSFVEIGLFDDKGHL
jgi:hypothetical protein